MDRERGPISLMRINEELLESWLAAVAQSVYFACGLEATEFVLVCVTATTSPFIKFVDNFQQSLCFLKLRSGEEMLFANRSTE
jgi:hypothetical protein